MRKYKVYYNEDCQKYGVQKQTTDYTGTHWTQILIYKGQEVAPFAGNSRKAHCYTLYRGVAERWLRELEEQNTSNGDHICANCGAIPRGQPVVTIDENDYCQDCAEVTQ